MSERFLSATGMAHEIGVSEKTIRDWRRIFDVPVKKVGGKWQYDQEAIEIMKTIQSLRPEHGENTIRRVIDPNGSEEKKELSHSLDLGAIRSVLVEVVEQKSEVAERYAKATYQIGTLEERVRSLEEENQRLKGLLEKSNRSLWERIKNWLS